MSLGEFQSAIAQHRPQMAVVLGSGLGDCPTGYDRLASVAFADVPGLAAPSVHGHRGEFILAKVAGVAILLARGRVHFYEGYPWEKVEAPVRQMAQWGITQLLLTNAAGGIHETLWPGDLMLLSGHLWLQSSQGCRQPTIDRSPYDVDFQQQILTNERQAGRPLLAGVYAAVTGPCYETPAEIRAFRTLGADAVGMSTAREALIGAQLGLRVAAISCITNKAAGLVEGKLDHAEVLENAQKPQARLSEIITALAQG
jgi:purine-nucleoside phosphorylase